MGDLREAIDVSEIFDDHNVGRDDQIFVGDHHQHVSCRDLPSDEAFDAVNDETFGSSINDISKYLAPAQCGFWLTKIQRPNLTSPRLLLNFSGRGKTELGLARAISIVAMLLAVAISRWASAERAQWHTGSSTKQNLLAQRGVFGSALI